MPFINQYRTEGDVTYISLNHGQEAIIDTEDLEKILRYRWGALHSKRSLDGVYYAVAAGPIYMHRLIMDAPNGKQVDHRNHNTLDNRKENLRLATNQQNNMHRKEAYSTSKIGVRGISIHKCKPSGLMYAYRCHCVQCKVAKYFPHSDEGLEAAKKFAEEHDKIRKALIGK
ncbi:MAG: HNH endonuclease signature motif containing protein [Ktedonobacterales bacterium]